MLEAALLKGVFRPFDRMLHGIPNEPDNPDPLDGAKWKEARLLILGADQKSGNKFQKSMQNVPRHFNLCSDNQSGLFPLDAVETIVSTIVFQSSL